MGTSGQIAIASSVAFSSLSSTALLQLVSKPYVIALYEEEKTVSDRKLYAEKVNIFGKVEGYPFLLSDVSKQPKHPFASFCLQSSGENFYVYGEGVEHDSDLREKICKD